MSTVLQTRDASVKFLNGDHITDDELDLLIEAHSTALDGLKGLGNEYKIIRSQLTTRLERLLTMYYSRNR